MATYNGESYLAEQIESILRQTETRWKLIIQDDCSTDRTAAVAQEFAGHAFQAAVVNGKQIEAPARCCGLSTAFFGNIYLCAIGHDP